MPNLYLDPDDIKGLVAARDRIFAEHNQVWQDHNIDILANDTLSALSIWEKVSQYDPDYNINFHRNGEDAKSQGVLIEQKCATIKPGVRGGLGQAGFQFHAQGKLFYDRYIFAVRRKDDLKLARLWDVSSPTAISQVHASLAAGKQGWIDKGKPNHDAILVKEQLLRSLTVQQCHVIDSCHIFCI
jgi:hypothetical protein